MIRWQDYEGRVDIDFRDATTCRLRVGKLARPKRHDFHSHSLLFVYVNCGRAPARCEIKSHDERERVSEGHGSRSTDTMTLPDSHEGEDLSQLQRDDDKKTEEREQKWQRMFTISDGGGFVSPSSSSGLRSTKAQHAFSCILSATGIYGSLKFT